MRCAFYEKEITPPLGSDIPGYYRKHCADGVLDRLYAKAFVAESEGNICAIIAVDALEVQVKIHDAVIARIREFIDIPQENIALCATHTHMGIPVGEAYEGAEEDEEFIRIVCKLMADCVVLAYQRLEECTISYAAGYEDSVSYNRNYVMKDGEIKTNPVWWSDKIERAYGKIDPELPIMVVKDMNGKLKGTILSFAMHLDCIGGDKISADYAGVISRELKKEYGEDFVSMYVAGASGDINHINSFTPKLTMRDDYYIEAGTKLAAEAKKAIKKATPISNEVIAAKKEHIILKVRKASEKELKDAQYLVENPEKAERDLYAIMARQLVWFDAQKREESDVIVQMIRIGDVIFAALPGEQYSQFGLKLKEASPTGKTVVATLCNGYCGYIPTEDLFGTAVYEVKLAAGSYLEEKAGEKVLNLAIKLVEDLMK